MSANLYWEPVERTKQSCRVGAPQAFMTALDKAFGSRTPELCKDDIPTLRGMAAVSNDEWARELDALAEAVQGYGRIQITAEY